jgi:hypothetical protein
VAGPQLGLVLLVPWTQLKFNAAAAAAAATRSAVSTSVFVVAGMFYCIYLECVCTQAWWFWWFVSPHVLLLVCVSARLALKDGDKEILDGSWELLVHSVS